MTPAAPEQPADPRRWWILAALWSCVLVIGFDVTILNVALPTLAAELDASTSQLQLADRAPARAATRSKRRRSTRSSAAWKR